MIRERNLRIENLLAILILVGLLVFSILRVFDLAPAITLGAVGEFTASSIPLLLISQTPYFLYLMKNQLLESRHLIATANILIALPTIAHLQSPSTTNTGTSAMRSGGGFVGYFFSTPLEALLTNSLATFFSTVVFSFCLLLMLPKKFITYKDLRQFTRQTSKKILVLFSVSLIFLLVFQLIPSSFLTYSNVDQTSVKAESDRKKPTTTNTAPKEPQEQFKIAISNWLEERLSYYNGYAVNDSQLSLQFFVQDYAINSSDQFETATISLSAEIPHEDLRDGGTVGVYSSKTDGLQPKVFCAGMNSNGLSTFLSFVQDFFFSREYDLNNLDSVPLPKSGIIFEMEWRAVKVATDKFGNEDRTYSPIGTDRVGISSSNITMVQDHSKADYFKLSDLVVPKKAKSSWYSGICESAQRINN